MFWLSYDFFFSILCNAFLLKSVISCQNSCEQWTIQEKIQVKQVTKGGGMEFAGGIEEREISGINYIEKEVEYSQECS